jgi:site-specific DNA recombinase
MKTKDTLRVAIYARVSSDQQAEEGTIASQVEALRQRIRGDGCVLDAEMCFVDDGYSGATLIRPALERLRDQVAGGVLDRLYLHSPDRLARNYAYQFLLVDEFHRAGVEVVFLNRELGRSPEDDLLLQVQGVIAEYERAKIRERSRRGKLHGARSGNVNVLCGAPYGYHYVSKQEGAGRARYEILLEEARVVRQIFAWVTRERLSLAEVARRLAQQAVPTRTGKLRWSPATIAYILKNPAYQGLAGFGKSRCGERQPPLRPRRGQPDVPRRPYSVTRADTQPIFIEVPALVSAEEFAAVADQLAENRRRHRRRGAQSRYLLQGLVVCKQCAYAWHGLCQCYRTRGGQKRRQVYYRCGGRQATRWQDQPGCAVRQMRASELEEVVWKDVCQLLRHPDKIEEEYQRRLQGEPSPGQRGVEPLTKVIQKVKRTIARLIDAYSEGLLEKGEFEPRLRGAKERLGKLEIEAQTQAVAEAQQAELRLVIGKLQDFADQVSEGLDKANGNTRREIIRALVKRVEVDDEDIRIVYRVAPFPFVKGPDGGILQDCWKRGEFFSTSWIGKGSRPLFLFFFLKKCGHSSTSDCAMAAS